MGEPRPPPNPNGGGGGAPNGGGTPGGGGGAGQPGKGGGGGGGGGGGTPDAGAEGGGPEGNAEDDDAGPTWADDRFTGTAPNWINREKGKNGSGDIRIYKIEKNILLIFRSKVQKVNGFMLLFFFLNDPSMLTRWPTYNTGCTGQVPGANVCTAKTNCI